MTGAAVPFVLAAYLLASALLVTGIRRSEWANALAGIIVVVALTTALQA